MYKTLKKDDTGVALAIPITIQDLLEAGLALDEEFNPEALGREDLWEAEEVLRVTASVFYDHTVGEMRVGVGLELLDIRQESPNPEKRKDWIDLLNPADTGSLEHWEAAGWTITGLANVLRKLARERLPNFDEIVMKEAEPFLSKIRAQETTRIRFVGLCDNTDCLARDICAFYPDESCATTRARAGLKPIEGKTKFHD